MVASNVDHYFYLKNLDKEKKDVLLSKDVRRHKVTLDEINIICPHMKYEEVEYNQENLIESYWEWNV